MIGHWHMRLRAPQPRLSLQRRRASSKSGQPCRAARQSWRPRLHQPGSPEAWQQLQHRPQQSTAAPCLRLHHSLKMSSLGFQLSTSSSLALLPGR